MFLNRVIVLTVRQAGVYVCVRVFAWALLLQGADNREVCLNREGAQRPCSSCRLWKWMIGPPNPPPVCPSVCLVWQISPTSFSVLHCIFVFCLHVCAGVRACVLWQPLETLTEQLSSCCQICIENDSWVCMLLYLQMTCAGRPAWTSAHEGSPHLFESQHWQIYIPTRCTHAHTFSSTLCLHVSVSDVVFSASLHFHMCAPIVSGSDA